MTDTSPEVKPRRYLLVNEDGDVFATNNEKAQEFADACNYICIDLEERIANGLTPFDKLPEPDGIEDFEDEDDGDEDD